MLALGVDLRACWVGSTAANQCRVENLEWGMADAAESLDMHCREQFTITARDGTYENLLAAVPAEFVGTKEQLMPLVQLLCSEMAAAFSTCSVCPPWRTYRSMLSKWIPAKVCLPLPALPALPHHWASDGCYSPLGCCVCKPMQLLHAHRAVKAVPYPRLQTIKPCRPKGLVTRRSRTWPCSPIWEVSRPPAP